MALLLEMMARRQAVDQKSSEEMIALLARQRINNRIPALLPRGLQIAHKTGEWENATHDVGVVYAPKGTYVIALMSSKPWNINALAKLSGIVYEYLQAL
jgi:beta-lactamase class A